MLSCSFHDFGCFHIGDVFIPCIIILPRPKKQPNRRSHPLSHIEKCYNMERLLNQHRKFIRLYIKTQNSTINIDGVRVPPPHHGGYSVLLSSIKQQQMNEKEKHHITTKEQARYIENNIHLFFDTSLTLHSTIPHHTPNHSSPQKNST